MVDGSPKKVVLVVEDEALIRLGAADVLEEAGFEVLEAGSADEAIAVLSQHGAVDLLFSDVNMPGCMDGLDLASVVHERWPQTLLLLTSGRQSLDEEVIPDDGKFLSKPWTPEALVTKIQRALEA